MTHGPPRPLRRQRIGLLLSVGALSLAACTSSPIADPPTTDTTVIVTVPATTTTSSSEPEAPTTSETTVEDVEAAVREVHTRFMTELTNRDERVVGPEEVLVLAEEITTGRVLARLKDSVASKLESGQRTVSPGYVSNIVTVEVTDDRAVVLDCSLGRAEGYSADGELLVEAEDHFRFRETWLVLESDMWLVEEFITGGDLACEPDAAA